MLPTASCGYPSESCPVSATAYGYIPNLGANIVFDTFFGIALVVHIFIVAIPPRTNRVPRRHWSFSAFALLGTTLSFLGFLCRIWLNSDVWDKAALAVELMCNILAPNLIVGAIYLVTKHVVHHFGAQYSRLPAQHYATAFLASNVVSVVFLAVGAGVAIAKGPARDSSTGNTGTALIMAGIALQVATMLVFGGLVLEFGVRWRRHRRSASINEIEDGTPATREETKDSGPVPSTYSLHLKWFVRLMTLAFVFVFIRCVYRLAEYAGGWGNPIMQNEPAFLVLEGVMILFAWACLTVGHPAFLFSEMCASSRDTS